MKKIRLFRTLDELAANTHSSKSCPHVSYNRVSLEDVKNEIINDLIDSAIASENARMVKPVLIRYADTVSHSIPVMFRVRGYIETRIRHNQGYDHHGLHRHWLEVAADSGGWFVLSDEDMVRLYEALEEGGHLEGLM